MRIRNMEEFKPVESLKSVGLVTAYVDAVQYNTELDNYKERLDAEIGRLSVERARTDEHLAQVSEYRRQVLGRLAHLLSKVERAEKSRPVSWRSALYTMIPWPDGLEWATEKPKSKKERKLTLRISADTLVEKLQAKYPEVASLFSTEVVEEALRAYKDIQQHKDGTYSRKLPKESKKNPVARTLTPEESGAIAQGDLGSTAKRIASISKKHDVCDAIDAISKKAGIIEPEISTDVVCKVLLDDEDRTLAELDVELDETLDRAADSLKNNAIWRTRKSKETTSSAATKKAD